MSHNPNTIKSQDDLNPCNDGKRSSNVLLSTIEELERTKKQLEIACNTLCVYSKSPYPYLARTVLDRIAKFVDDYTHYWEQQLKDLELNK